MPAPKSTTTSSGANRGASGKSKTASTSGTATPVSSAEKDTLDVSAIATLSGGKPDKKAYDAQQEKYKKEIDALQVKLSAIREKISLATGNSGPSNERRKELLAELDSIRGSQSQTKQSRSKVFDEMNTLKENVQKKVKDLQAAKAKIPFKTVEEVDAHIRNLEKQVESGSLKLADEKRALADISASKRSRKLVEGFQAAQASIEADRQKIDDLKKQLDDPEAKAASDRYEAIKAELDELKKQGDEAAAGRNKLFQEREKIQNELQKLYDGKRAAQAAYREANDRHWQKINDERQRRAEREHAARVAEEQARKKEAADRLLEEAQVPAYQFEIEDCQTLIDSLSGKSSENVTFKSVPQEKTLAGVPKLEVRKVEAEAPQGTILRKKGEDDDAYFVAAKRNKGGNNNANKKGSSKPVAEAPATPTTPAAPTNLQLPLPTLSALLSLSIPPPASSADVPRVVEDLKIKKAWFEANQARVTAENIAKAKARIQRLDEKAAAATDAGEATPDASAEAPAADAANVEA